MSPEERLLGVQDKLDNVRRQLNGISMMVEDGLRKTTLEDIELQLKKLNQTKTVDRNMIFDMLEEQTILIVTFIVVLAGFYIFWAVMHTRKTYHQENNSTLKFIKFRQGI